MANIQSHRDLLQRLGLADSEETERVLARILYAVPLVVVTVKSWLEAALQDADRRGLPDLKPLLEALAKATSTLRSAEWNADASGEFDRPQEPDGR